MSYDLMVFELADAPTDHIEFIKWYHNQTQWSEQHSYDDPDICSQPLHNFFQELITLFPPMNGPLASDDVDDSKVTDYSIGKSIIYAAFAWSEAESAYNIVKELAIKHNVGFFDVNSKEGEIFTPNNSHHSQKQSKPWWKLW